MAIDAFLTDLDSAWAAAGAPVRLALRVLGSTALFLQTDYRRGTKDSDVLETVDLRPHSERLVKLAGPDSELHRRHRIYLDVVGNGIPFLPLAPVWRLRRQLTWFDIFVLDVADVAVSKLKPARRSDLEDIDAMISRGLLTHDLFVARFRSAVDAFSWDARAPKELPRYLACFHRVERDLFDVPETTIELPDWH